jgi:hypothetical protein
MGLNYVVPPFIWVISNLGWSSISQFSIQKNYPPRTLHARYRGHARFHFSASPGLKSLLCKNSKKRCELQGSGLIGIFNTKIYPLGTLHARYRVHARFRVFLFLNISVEFWMIFLSVIAARRSKLELDLTKASDHPG